MARPFPQSRAEVQQLDTKQLCAQFFRLRYYRMRGWRPRIPYPAETALISRFETLNQ